MPPALVEDPGPRWAPALTVRSVLASLLALFGLAVVIQISTISVGMEQSAEFGLPLPGLGLFLILLGLVFAGISVARWRLLTRGELLCVFYCLVLAAPLMTQGFWHRVVGITATIPRTGDFRKLDVLSPRLWPHGPNLLARAVEGEMVLTGEQAGTVVSQKVRLPLQSSTGANANGAVIPGEPYLLRVAVRAEHLGADAYYFVRARQPGGDTFQEILRDRDPGRVTALTPDGFVPVGAYGFEFSAEGGAEEVELEFGLSGVGRVQLREPVLYDVSALERLYTGVESLPAKEFDALPPADRLGVVRQPETFLSWEGLTYFLRAGIPVGDWLVPLATWGGLIVLLLGGTLAINAIMRRQWLDSERLPLPLARIPAALIGEPDDAGRFPAIWKMRVLWVGAALGLVWSILRGLHFYNPNIPDLSVKIDLQPYFGPAWGGFWNGVTFEVLAVVVAVAVFVELNVLLSLVVGFFLFRALLWLGFLTGWSGLPGYPFAQQQQTGSFLLYGLLILLLAHKHLWRTMKEAIRPGSVPGMGAEREIFSYRTAYVLLVAVLGGGFLWAGWTGVSPGGMVFYLTYMLLIGLVAAKFRAEAGVPSGYFTPQTAAMILLLLGGIPVFGAELVLLTFITSFLFSVPVFFLIPGAQLEIMELGRRYQVRPWHISGVIVLGLVGGFLIGGWVFLSGAYATGGESMRYTWAFDTKAWYFAEFNSAFNAAADGRETGSWLAPSTWAYIYGGGVAAVLAILRQMFAGFWLHPIGFILGPSFMMQTIWGSVLVACVLRYLFVRFGGSLGVRLTLQPLFIGVLLGSVVGWGLWFGVATVLRSQGVEAIYGPMP